MIDVKNNFIEVTALGEDSRRKMWMRKLAEIYTTTMDWCPTRSTNAGLPIFRQLVFAEVCQMGSYTKAAETHLASTVMDFHHECFSKGSKKQHGRNNCVFMLCVQYGQEKAVCQVRMEDNFVRASPTRYNIICQIVVTLYPCPSFRHLGFVTSDMTRDVNPKSKGIMQQCVEPDNKWAEAYTKQSSGLLNLFDSE
ncbi:hypothetical protein FQR65_LT15046 [Abscondita terminalis]|nr:hypothetical protein FQR65_LT15046 [Abscondita terminalis]